MPKIPFFKSSERAGAAVTEPEQRSRDRRAMVGIILRMAVILTVTVLAVIAYGSRAWFINNTKTQTEGQTVSAKSQELYASNYQLYYWQTGETGALTCQTLDLSASASLEVLEMQPYDAISGNHTYDPVVVCVPLEGSAVEQGLPITVTLGREATQAAAIETDYRLGDVVEVSCRILTLTETEPEAIWSAAVAAQTPGESQVFGTAECITFTLSDYEPPADGVLRLYLVVDYHQETMLRLAKTLDVVAMLGKESASVVFDGDLTTISVALAEG